MLQSLSDELLKLKSATERFEETNENLRKILESIEKISLTHQKLTDNMGQFLAEMEKIDLEGKKTRELVQSVYEEAKKHLEELTHRHEAAVEDSLSKKLNELNDKFRDQTERIHQDNITQIKGLRLTRYLVLLGIAIEAAIIIRTFLF